MELELWQLDLSYQGLRIIDPGRGARLVASLAEHGQQTAVLVVKSEAGRYVLIDGYRRVAGLKSLGRDTVEAMVLEMTEPDALIFVHQQHTMGNRSALEDGWLIQELMDGAGMRMEELAVKLERSKSWVSRRLALVKELPEPVQALVRLGKVCAHGAMKYLVPLARANRDHCIRLTEAIGASRLSSRQLCQIYEAWRGADEAHRDRIVEQPLLFLKALAEVSRPLCALKGSQANHDGLLKDMDKLIHISDRLCRQLRQGGLKAEPPLFHKEMEAMWRQIQLSFGLLTERMEEQLRC